MQHFSSETTYRTCSYSLKTNISTYHINFKKGIHTVFHPCTSTFIQNCAAAVRITLHLCYVSFRIVTALEQIAIGSTNGSNFVNTTTSSSGLITQIIQVQV